ncbi:MAG: hypothetical protein ACOYKZ_03975 [Chlamydiia bacterium]
MKIDDMSSALVLPVGDDDDRMIWRWEIPYADLFPGNIMEVMLESPSTDRNYKLYSELACELFAYDFALALSTVLSCEEPVWQQVESDPGRLDCLQALDLLGPENRNKSWWLAGACEVRTSAECPYSKTGAISVWVYPEGDSFVFSITTSMTPFVFTDDIEDPRLEGIIYYAKYYEVLYRQRITRSTLEEWLETVRAFLRHVYAQAGYQTTIP